MYVYVIFLFFMAIFTYFFSDKIKEMTKRKIDSPRRSVDENRIILKYKNADYDVTDFLKKHPGGSSVLIKNNNKDIDQLMVDNNHSKAAYTILEKYKVNNF